MLAYFTSIGNGRTRVDTFDDVEIERNRLLAAGAHNMLRSRSRRWHKRRLPHSEWCRARLPQTLTEHEQRLWYEYNARECNCDSRKDVPLYKQFRQIGDPSEWPGRWVFDNVISVEEPHREALVPPEEDPFDRIVTEAHALSGQERTRDTEHFCSLAARAEFQGHPATASFVAYRLLQYTGADAEQVAAMLHKAEIEGSRWYSYRWIANNFDPPT